MGGCWERGVGQGVLNPGEGNSFKFLISFVQQDILIYICIYGILCVKGLIVIELISTFSHIATIFWVMRVPEIVSKCPVSNTVLLTVLTVMSS